MSEEQKQPQPGKGLSYQIGVTPEGRVQLAFSQELRWLQISPQAALELSKMLRKAAKKAVKHRTIH